MERIFLGSSPLLISLHFGASDVCTVANDTAYWGEWLDLTCGTPELGLSPRTPVTHPYPLHLLMTGSVQWNEDARRGREKKKATKRVCS
jgi:hypothetical protein